LAGVSQSAVSRCFNGGPGVSSKTRAAITKAADALGYKPNAIARMLSTRRSNLVAVIVANLGFNPDFVRTLNRQFVERGLTVMLFTLDQEEDADHVIEQFWQYRVDGVVSAARLSHKHVEMLAERSLPLVFINRTYANLTVNSVCCDQAEGERWLVERLCAAGHQRFAIITGPKDSSVSDQRVSGAVEWLRAAGVDPPHIVPGDFTYDGGVAAMRALAQAGNVPDAVICANDYTAIGCIDEARHGLKLRVPRDISVVGFDGAAPSRWASYDLVTVRQPTQAMVNAAIDMLMARIDDPDLAMEKRSYSGELVLGSSARMGELT
jgi:DNA-binding LacI/PurR family transcriptional regulator